MEKEHKSWLIIASLFLVLLAIVIAIIFFLKGDTTVTGKWNGTKVTETATCKSDQVVYPIYKYNNADDRLLKVVATFTDQNLDGISLTYQLKYNDLALAKQSDAENQAAMNISFSDNGFNPYAFDAKYSNVNGVFQMTLYTKPEDLNKNALKYFMLDDLKNTDIYTRDSVMETYANEGFNCVYKELNNKEENNEG